MKILNQTDNGQIGITKIEDKWLTKEEKTILLEIKIASGVIVLTE